MNHKHLPRGTERDPFSLTDLSQAKRVAHQKGTVIWARLNGAPDHLVEVYPGGRCTAYPMEILRRRWERQEPLEEGHKCKHSWETHIDSDPTAAGLIVDSFRQCIKCGQIREDRL